MNTLTITELVQSLKEVTSILRAVRYTVGLGKNQLIRLERAEGLIERAKASEVLSSIEIEKQMTSLPDGWEGPERIGDGEWIIPKNVVVQGTYPHEYLFEVEAGERSHKGERYMLIQDGMLFMRRAEGGAV